MRATKPYTRGQAEEDAVHLLEEVLGRTRYTVETRENMTEALFRIVRRAQRQGRRETDGQDT